MKGNFTNPETRQHLPNLPAYRQRPHHPHHASLPCPRTSGLLLSASQVWRCHHPTQPSQSIFLEVLHKTPSFVVHSYTYDAPYSPSVSTPGSAPIYQVHSIVFFAAATIAVPPTRGAIQSTRPRVLRYDRSQPSYGLKPASAC